MSALQKRRQALPQLKLGLTSCGYGGGHEAILSPPAGSPRPYAADSCDGLSTLYKFGEVLGSGSMAVVKRAVRRSDGCQVAIKQVSTDDPEVHQFVIQEFELMRRLRHPAIITVKDLHEGPSEILICMELCPDGSVENYVAEHGVFNEGSVRSLSAHLFQGVKYLHQKRVVHRDLKPDNLNLANNATTLKICDFNSATRIGNSECMLSDRGTRIFSAPELRFSRLWNERVDIWACGLCVYYMSKASLPFDIEGQDANAQLQSGILPDIDFGGMSKNSINLVEQCLTVDMQDRPPAMELIRHSFLLEGCKSSQELRQAAYSFVKLFSCGLVWMQESQRGQLGEVASHNMLFSEDSQQQHRLSGSDNLLEVSTSMNDWMERRDGAWALQKLASHHFERTEVLHSHRTEELCECSNEEEEEQPTLKSLGRKHFFTRASTSLLS